MSKPIIIVHPPLLPLVAPLLESSFDAEVTCLSAYDFCANPLGVAHGGPLVGVWVTRQEWDLLPLDHSSGGKRQLNSIFEHAMRVEVDVSSAGTSHVSVTHNSTENMSDRPQWGVSISADIISQAQREQQISVDESLKLLLALQQAKCAEVSERLRVKRDYLNINEQLLDLIAPLRSLPHQLGEGEHRASSLISELAERAEHVRSALNISRVDAQPKIGERVQCSLREMIIEALESLICPRSWLAAGPDFHVDVDAHATQRGLSLLFSLVARRDNAPEISLREDPSRPGHALLELSISQSAALNDQRRAESDITYLRALAELQEGSFQLRSSISGTSLITWTFSRSQKIESTAETTEQSHSAHGLVWLIDDEPGVRLTVRRWLTHLGYQVEVFEEGPALIETILQSSQPLPALIICDADMPMMSGLEVLARVAKEAPDVKRLLYTAREPNRWVIEAFNQGVIHRFIDKSAGPKALQECLSEMLRDQEERGRQLLALDELLSQRLVSLHLQPIFNAQTRKLEASEALMRSQHPEFRGPLDILDATQLAQRELDLQRVLTSLSCELRAQIPADVKLFMNIDPVIFGQPDHLDDAFSEIYPYASSVVLELTERGQLCGDAWVESVKYLRDRGFEIALDDLGAGYNSLGAVAAVSPEIIKLDISLVSNLHLSQPKREMVRLLSEYAQRHNIKTVAEGIELSEEAEWCTQLGMRWLQGYHLARPLPLERYQELYVQSADKS